MRLITIKLFLVIAILLLKVSLTFSQENEVLMPYLKVDKYGFANSKGEIIIEPVYDYVMLFENGYAMVRMDNEWGVLNKSGELLFEPKAKSISGFDENGLATVNIDDAYGVINTKGEWVVPLEYYWADVKSNFIKVINSSHQMALLDLTGKIVVDFNYNELRFPDSSFKHSNLIITKLDREYGLIEIEKKGKFNVRIPPKYQSLRILGDNLFEAKLDGELGLVNSKGEMIVPLKYNKFKKEDHLIIAEQEIAYEVRTKLIESEGYSSTTRRDDFEKEYDDERKIVYYLMTKEKQEKLKAHRIDLKEYPDIRMCYSLFDELGQVIIPAQFGQISLNKHLIQVGTDAGITLFDKKGTQVSSLLFEKVDEIKEDLILVKVRSEENTLKDVSELTERDKMIAHYNRFKFGFIDRTGKLIIPLNYNGAFAFDQKHAPVRQGDKWGLINKKGELIVDYIYDQLYYAGENRYGFRLGKRWGLLDLNGHEIIPANYYADDKAKYETDRFGGYSGLVFKNGKAKISKLLPGFWQTSTSLIDTNGVQLLPFKYVTIEEQYGGLFKVSLRNHDHDYDSYGLVDQHANVLVPVYQNGIWWLENEKVFVVSKSAFKSEYTYYNQKGQKVTSPYKDIEQEELREYSLLSNGYYKAKYLQYTVYFTPNGIPLFEK